MKKFPASILVFIFLSMIVAFADAQTQQKENTGDLVTVKTIAKEVSQYDIDRVKNEAIRAIDEICPLLGIKKKRIKIQILESGISNARGGIISINKMRVRKKRAPIVHEVTHLLAKHSENRFFSEGLAVYFQERFGEDSHGAFRRDRPLDDWVRSYENRLVSINSLANNNDIFGQVGTEERKIAYIEAGSFIKYLVEAYGEEKLKGLHNTWTLNYKKIYGKGLKELGLDWNKFVLTNNKNQKISKTYIKIQVADIVGSGGKVKFKIIPGDVLEVIRSQPCRGGRGECWEVKNTKTGETGFVPANRMKNRHHVFTKE